MPSSEPSSVTLTDQAQTTETQARCTCPIEESEQSDPSTAMATAVAFLEAKVRRVEQWLLQDLRHGRAERRLLENIISIKEEDLEYHKQRLDGVKKQAARLERELIECRWELLKCRRQERQTFADNLHLRSDNKLQILITKLRPYNFKLVNNSLVQYSDTEL
ncbi:uncharacterized protein LOC117639208 isoform X2 [Thrips palmi]|uniref:Uncharacterized protein LOC117639208 isoform X2 n=1 Tax=Thrips palmi TaxID=161013 RepID=A0A6P8Y9V3_THRPL|nr:uncharacterized protein LOC117639208 isoform X2 [Thrips palmi]